MPIDVSSLQPLNFNVLVSFHKASSWLQTTQRISPRRPLEPSFSKHQVQLPTVSVITNLLRTVLFASFTGVLSMSRIGSSLNLLHVISQRLVPESESLAVHMSSNIRTNSDASRFQWIEEAWVCDNHTSAWRCSNFCYR